jgi:hypothetical protein
MLTWLRAFRPAARNACVPYDSWLRVCGGAMLTFEFSGSNNVVYTNMAGSSVDVTIAVAGDAKLEVKEPRRTAPQHRLAQGGVVTLTVPGGQVIEVDAVSGTVRVEVVAVR